MASRTKERSVFWADVLTTAMEHSGYGNWFRRDEYVPYWDEDTSPAGDGFTADPVQAYAIITVDDEEVGEEHGKTFRVDADFLAHGFSVLTAPGKCSDSYRARLMEAYNDHEAGELDVFDALNIVECAVFGEVVYG